MHIMPTVKIALATYNGSKYICRQLDSLLAQTYPNLEIYIRDDGSTDGTVQILEEYIARNTTDKKITLLENNGKNLGCPASFYQIIRECGSADYYAFCDQDDIWYPDKVKWAVERLQESKKESAGTEFPCVYFSACDYYTEEGEFLRHSPVWTGEVGLTDVLYYTPASGFLLVFNEAARQELVLGVDPGRELHDRWLLRGAACFGKVIPDSRCTAAHIRHSKAVTAEDSSNSNLVRSFLKNEICGTAMTDSKGDLGYFLCAFQERLSKSQRKVLELFAAPNRFGRQIRKLFYPKRLRVRLAGEAAIRILFLIGKI